MKDWWHSCEKLEQTKLAKKKAFLSDWQQQVYLDFGQLVQLHYWDMEDIMLASQYGRTLRQY